MSPMEIAAPGVVVFALIVGVPSIAAWVGLRRESVRRARAERGVRS
ncbi:MAG: hypothetical protein ACOH14_14250 [Rhodoglobus sp.]